MLKVFLTGGNGFIGKNLREQLAAKFDITSPGREQLDLLNGGEVKKFLDEGRFDVVIHAANFGGSRAQAGFSGVFEKNKQMFLNLAENRGSFGKMIFFGSGAEYGKQRDLVKVKETDFGQTKPEDEYGQAKYFASEYIAGSENITNLRLFGVFGKYEDYATRFISNAICRSLSGLPIVLRRNTIFDYIYINDLARVVEYFISSEVKHKFYNVGRGEGVELLTLAELIKGATWDVSKIEIKAPGLGKEYTCDNSLFMAEFGGFEFTPFAQAVGELAYWYRQNLDLVDKAKLNFDA